MIQKIKLFIGSQDSGLEAGAVIEEVLMKSKLYEEMNFQLCANGEILGKRRKVMDG
jgi:hypothetical protein